MKRNALTPLADRGLAAPALRAKLALGNRLQSSMFCAPRGLLGRLGGGLMAMDRETGAWVLGLLAIGGSDAVLEIGSGPGVGLELAAKILPFHGRIVGVDSSQTMVDMARHRNQQAIEAGRVEVKLGTADKLPFDNATFDAALTINSLHLWTDPLGALREIRRTMRPGGRIAIAISRFSHESSEGFINHLTDAGFERASVQKSEHGTCAIARAPSEEKE